MQIVTAKRAISPIKNGVTKPYFVTCDDGETYAVKFKQNPFGARALVNEYICAQIAISLNLPLASPSLVRVDSNFINDYSDDISKHIGEEVKTGYHFGSKKIKKVFPVSTSEMLESANNIEKVPDILLFDHWVCNIDRDWNGGNLLFDASNMELVIIDHTHAFELASIWTANDLNLKIGEPFRIFDFDGKVYNKLVPFINGNEPFHSIINKILRLTREDLWDIISNVPQDWQVSHEDRIALLEYLLDRKNRIKELLPKLKPLLPYWKGGIESGTIV
jgi:hypothetical protein